MNKMSVDCEVFIGYTVNLKEDLTNEDFEFFENFTDSHREYSVFNRNSDSKVKFVEDGMNGLYARLVYIDKRLDSEDFYRADNFFSASKSPNNFDEVYEELNKAYRLMYGKDLEKSQVEYAVWFHIS
jgi:hypothetical protein